MRLHFLSALLIGATAIGSIFSLSEKLRAEEMGEALRSLPVQDAGRVKPFDTFAKETLRLVYGKESYKGRSAVDVVFTWLLIPEQWDQMPLVEVRNSGLREALKITDAQKVHFSPNELFRNERAGLVFQELRAHRDLEDKLNPYFQDVQRLENQLTLFHAIKQGMAIRVAPNPESDTWYSVAELPEDLANDFQTITLAFVKAVSARERGDQSELSLQKAELNEAVQKFKNKIGVGEKINETKINAELHYNGFHPFAWAAGLYLFGAIFLVFFMSSERRWTLLAGYGLVGLAFLLHTYGMALRSYLTGRPPVTNMYETVVWVPWGGVVFAAVLEKFQKNRLVLMSAALVSVLCLILTHFSPTVLDKSLNPLEPVLRSNFWLTTHVLIIVSSYGAFFLAFVLGDLLLFYYLRDEKKYAKQINQGVQSIYRSIQIGVVLLAAGTILGGVWADYSWGRFWGWDPKETWALIALLGYLAILHGRLAGWIRPFGMAASSVISFSLVIMAWYGVNFVLGAGLHSYGFGAGGVEYVSAFVAAHFLFVAYVVTLRSRMFKAQA